MDALVADLRASQGQPQPGPSAQIVEGDQPGLPTPPPSIAKRRTDPFAKENLSRTLLDISSAFLSSPDFFQGLGGAAQAVGGRMDELQAGNAKSVQYGGPEGQFEITTDADGNRTIREVPEFAKAVADKRAAAHAMDPKELMDVRARAVRAIQGLPPGEQAAAYADLIANPAKYGGLDVTGMPETWDPTYGAVAGGMGQTVAQAEAADARDRAFGHRKEVDERRLQQGDQRVAQGGQRVSQGERRLSKPSGGAKKSSGPPAGFILD